jgi:hypothetical protein
MTPNVSVLMTTGSIFAGDAAPVTELPDASWMMMSAGS